MHIFKKDDSLEGLFTAIKLLLGAKAEKDIRAMKLTVNGLKTITLENCVEGKLLELNIIGNNTVFDYLYPSNDLYPSDTLYPSGDSRIIVTGKDGNKQIYELGVMDVLRQKNNVYDEYMYIVCSCMCFVISNADLIEFGFIED